MQLPCCTRPGLLVLLLIASVTSGPLVKNHNEISHKQTEKDKDCNKKLVNELFHLFSKIPSGFDPSNEFNEISKPNYKPSVICWTHEVTNITDVDGNVINEISSYSISFETPKEMSENYVQNREMDENGNCKTFYVIPAEVQWNKDRNTVTKVKYITCSSSQEYHYEPIQNSDGTSSIKIVRNHKDDKSTTVPLEDVEVETSPSVETRINFQTLAMTTPLPVTVSDSFDEKSKETVQPVHNPHPDDNPETHEEVSELEYDVIDEEPSDGGKSILQDTTRILPNEEFTHQNNKIPSGFSHSILGNEHRPDVMSVESLEEFPDSSSISDISDISDLVPLPHTDHATHPNKQPSIPGNVLTSIHDTSNDDQLSDFSDSDYISCDDNESISDEYIDQPIIPSNAFVAKYIIMNLNGENLVRCFELERQIFQTDCPQNIYTPKAITFNKPSDVPIYSTVVNVELLQPDQLIINYQGQCLLVRNTKMVACPNDPMITVIGKHPDEIPYTENPEAELSVEASTPEPIVKADFVAKYIKIFPNETHIKCFNLERFMVQVVCPYGVKLPQVTKLYTPKDVQLTSTTLHPTPEILLKNEDLVQFENDCFLLKSIDNVNCPAENVPILEVIYNYNEEIDRTTTVRSELKPTENVSNVNAIGMESTTTKDITKDFSTSREVTNIKEVTEKGSKKDITTPLPEDKEVFLIKYIDVISPNQKNIMCFKLEKLIVSVYCPNDRKVPEVTLWYVPEDVTLLQTTISLDFLRKTEHVIKMKDECYAVETINKVNCPDDNVLILTVTKTHPEILTPTTTEIHEKYTTIHVPDVSYDWSTSTERAKEIPINDSKEEVTTSSTKEKEDFLIKYFDIFLPSQVNVICYKQEKLFVQVFCPNNMNIPEITLWYVPEDVKVLKTAISPDTLGKYEQIIKMKDECYVMETNNQVTCPEYNVPILNVVKTHPEILMQTSSETISEKHTTVGTEENVEITVKETTYPSGGSTTAEPIGASTALKDLISEQDTTPVTTETLDTETKTHPEILSQSTSSEAVTQEHTTEKEHATGITEENVKITIKETIHPSGGSTTAEPIGASTALKDLISEQDTTPVTTETLDTETKTNPEILSKSTSSEAVTQEHTTEKEHATGISEENVKITIKETIHPSGGSTTAEPIGASTALKDLISEQDTTSVTTETLDTETKTTTEKYSTSEPTDDWSISTEFTNTKEVPTKGSIVEVTAPGESTTAEPIGASTALKDLISEQDTTPVTTETHDTETKTHPEKVPQTKSSEETTEKYFTLSTTSQPITVASDDSSISTEFANIKEISTKSNNDEITTPSKEENEDFLVKYIDIIAPNHKNMYCFKQKKLFVRVYCPKNINVPEITSWYVPEDVTVLKTAISPEFLHNTQHIIRMKDECFVVDSKIQVNCPDDNVPILTVTKTYSKIPEQTTSTEVYSETYTTVGTTMKQMPDDWTTITRETITDGQTTKGIPEEVTTPAPTEKQDTLVTVTKLYPEILAHTTSNKELTEKYTTVGTSPKQISDEWSKITTVTITDGQTTKGSTEEVTTPATTDKHDMILTVTKAYPEISAQTTSSEEIYTTLSTFGTTSKPITEASDDWSVSTDLTTAKEVTVKGSNDEITTPSTEKRKSFLLKYIDIISPTKKYINCFKLVRLIVRVICPNDRNVPEVTSWYVPKDVTLFKTPINPDLLRKIEHIIRRKDKCYAVETLRKVNCPDNNVRILTVTNAYPKILTHTTSTEENSGKYTTVSSTTKQISDDWSTSADLSISKEFTTIDSNYDVTTLPTIKKPDFLGKLIDKTSPNRIKIKCFKLKKVIVRVFCPNDINVPEITTWYTPEDVTVLKSVVRPEFLKKSQHIIKMNDKCYAVKAIGRVNCPDEEVLILTAMKTRPELTTQRSSYTYVTEGKTSKIISETTENWSTTKELPSTEEVTNKDSTEVTTQPTVNENDFLAKYIDVISPYDIKTQCFKLEKKITRVLCPYDMNIPNVNRMYKPDDVNITSTTFYIEPENLTENDIIVKLGSACYLLKSIDTIECPDENLPILIVTKTDAGFTTDSQTSTTLTTASSQPVATDNLDNDMQTVSQYYTTTPYPTSTYSTTAKESQSTKTNDDEITVTSETESGFPEQEIFDGSTTTLPVLANNEFIAKFINMISPNQEFDTCFELEKHIVRVDCPNDMNILDVSTWYTPDDALLTNVKFNLQTLEQNQYVIKMDRNCMLIKTVRAVSCPDENMPILIVTRTYPEYKSLATDATTDKYTTTDLMTEKLTTPSDDWSMNTIEITTKSSASKKDLLAKFVDIISPYKNRTECFKLDKHLNAVFCPKNMDIPKITTFTNQNDVEIGFEKEFDFSTSTKNQHMVKLSNYACFVVRTMETISCPDENVPILIITKTHFDDTTVATSTSAFTDSQSTTDTSTSNLNEDKTTTSIMTDVSSSTIWWTTTTAPAEVTTESDNYFTIKIMDLGVVRSNSHSDTMTSQCNDVEKLVTIVTCPNKYENIPIIKEENFPADVTFVEKERTYPVNENEILLRGRTQCYILRRIQAASCSKRKNPLLVFRIRSTDVNTSTLSPETLSTVISDTTTSVQDVTAMNHEISTSTTTSKDIKTTTYQITTEPEDIIATTSNPKDKQLTETQLPIEKETKEETTKVHKQDANKTEIVTTTEKATSTYTEIIPESTEKTTTDDEESDNSLENVSNESCSDDDDETTTDISIDSDELPTIKPIKNEFPVKIVDVYPKGSQVVQCVEVSKRIYNIELVPKDISVPYIDDEKIPLDVKYTYSSQIFSTDEEQNIFVESKLGYFVLREEKKIECPKNTEDMLSIVRIHGRPSDTTTEIDSENTTHIVQENTTKRNNEEQSSTDKPIEITEKTEYVTLKTHATSPIDENSGSTIDFPENTAASSEIDVVTVTIPSEPTSQKSDLLTKEETKIVTTKTEHTSAKNEATTENQKIITTQNHGTISTVDTTDKPIFSTTMESLEPSTDITVTEQKHSTESAPHTEKVITVTDTIKPSDKLLTTEEDSATSSVVTEYENEHPHELTTEKDVVKTTVQEILKPDENLAKDETTESTTVTEVLQNTGSSDKPIEVTITETIKPVKELTTLTNTVTQEHTTEKEHGTGITDENVKITVKETIYPLGESTTAEPIGASTALKDLISEQDTTPVTTHTHDTETKAHPEILPQTTRSEETTEKYSTLSTTSKPTTMASDNWSINTEFTNTKDVPTKSSNDEMTTPSREENEDFLVKYIDIIAPNHKNIYCFKQEKLFVRVFCPNNIDVPEITSWYVPEDVTVLKTAISPDFLHKTEHIIRMEHQCFVVDTHMQVNCPDENVPILTVTKTYSKIPEQTTSTEIYTTVGTTSKQITDEPIGSSTALKGLISEGHVTEQVPTEKPALTVTETVFPGHEQTTTQKPAEPSTTLMSIITEENEAKEEHQTGYNHVSVTTTTDRGTTEILKTETTLVQTDKPETELITTDGNEGSSTTLTNTVTQEHTTEKEHSTGITEENVKITVKETIYPSGESTTTEPIGTSTALKDLISEGHVSEQGPTEKPALTITEIVFPSHEQTTTEKFPETSTALKTIITTEHATEAMHHSGSTAETTVITKINKTMKPSEESITTEENKQPTTTVESIISKEHSTKESQYTGSSEKTVVVTTINETVKPGDEKEAKQSSTTEESTVIQEFQTESTHHSASTGKTVVVTTITETMKPIKEFITTEETIQSPTNLDPHYIGSSQGIEETTTGTVNPVNELTTKENKKFVTTENPVTETSDIHPSSLLTTIIGNHGTERIEITPGTTEGEETTTDNTHTTIMRSVKPATKNEETTSKITTTTEVETTEDNSPVLVKYFDENKNKLRCFEIDILVRVKRVRCPADTSQLPRIRDPALMKMLCPQRVKHHSKDHQNGLSILRRFNMVIHDPAEDKENGKN